MLKAYKRIIVSCVLSVVAFQDLCFASQDDCYQSPVAKKRLFMSPLSDRSTNKREVERDDDNPTTAKKSRVQNLGRSKKCLSYPDDENVINLFSEQITQPAIIARQLLPQHFQSIEQFQNAFRGQKFDLGQLLHNLEANVLGLTKKSELFFQKEHPSGLVFEGFYKEFLSCLSTPVVIEGKTGQPSIQQILREQLLPLPPSVPSLYMKMVPVERVKEVSRVVRQNILPSIGEFKSVYRDFLFYKRLIAQWYELFESDLATNKLGAFFVNLTEQKSLFQQFCKDAGVFLERCWDVERDVRIHWPYNGKDAFAFRLLWDPQYWDALRSMQDINDLLLKNFAAYCFMAGLSEVDLQRDLGSLANMRFSLERDPSSVRKFSSLQAILDLDASFGVIDLRDPKMVMRMISEVLRSETFQSAPVLPTFREKSLKENQEEISKYYCYSLDVRKKLRKNVNGKQYTGEIKLQAEKLLEDHRTIVRIVQLLTFGNERDQHPLSKSVNSSQLRSLEVCIHQTSKIESFMRQHNQKFLPILQTGLENVSNNYWV